MSSAVCVLFGDNEPPSKMKGERKNAIFGRGKVGSYESCIETSSAIFAAAAASDGAHFERKVIRWQVKSARRSGVSRACRLDGENAASFADFEMVAEPNHARAARDRSGVSKHVSVWPGRK